MSFLPPPRTRKRCSTQPHSMGGGGVCFKILLPFNRFSHHLPYIPWEWPLVFPRGQASVWWFRSAKGSLETRHWLRGSLQWLCDTVKHSVLQRSSGQGFWHELASRPDCLWRHAEGHGILKKFSPHLGSHSYVYVLCCLPWCCSMKNQM